MALRAAVLAAAITPILPSAVVDQVYISGITAAATGAVTAYNSTARINVDGNVFSNVDAFFSALSSGASLSAGGGGGGTPAAAAAQRRVLRANLAFAAPKSGMTRRIGGAARRASSLDLVVPAAAAPAPGSTAATVTFNVVFASVADAALVKASLTAPTIMGVTAAAAPVLRALAGGGTSIAAALSNATRANVTAEVDAASVKSITLDFRRTVWLVFLQWLYDNIRVVLAGACVLIVGFTALIAASREKKRRAAVSAVRRAAAARAKAAIAPVSDEVRRRMLRTHARAVLRRELAGAMRRAAAAARAARFLPRGAAAAGAASGPGAGRGALAPATRGLAARAAVKPPTPASRARGECGEIDASVDVAGNAAAAAPHGLNAGAARQAARRKQARAPHPAADGKAPEAAGEVAAAAPAPAAALVPTPALAPHHAAPASSRAARRAAEVAVAKWGAAAPAGLSGAGAISAEASVRATDAGTPVLITRLPRAGRAALSGLGARLSPSHAAQAAQASQASQAAQAAQAAPAAVVQDV